MLGGWGQDWWGRWGRRLAGLVSLGSVGRCGSQVRR